jgi:NAD(P)-dependent dehydrogenase (short-subunit alcohol dehydrogenase family)
MLLEGKVGIVSGVGPGIGRAIALALAREGADVVLAARGDDTPRSVAAEIEGLGRRAISVPTDITDGDSCVHLAEATHAAFGRIDVLVNNAALARPVVHLADGDLDDWRPAMEVNFWGTLRLTQAVVPYMRARGDGRVIMINASASRSHAAGYGPYTSSKAALLAASRVLATELGPLGIRVNSVLPSVTVTPSFRGFLAERSTQEGVDAEELMQRYASVNVLGYVPPADEVAGAVVFFASDLGRAVTGQFLHVSSGAVMEA